MTSASRTASRVPAALAASVAVGVAAGAATSYLQGVLPDGWNSLANSGAVWTALAFLTAAACARIPWTGAVSGGLTVLGEVAGYYALASPLRDIPTTMSERVLWTLAALWIGPLAGLGGYWWRHGTTLRSMAAATAMSAVLVGEGLHLLTRGSGVRAFGWAEVGVGGAAAVAAVAGRPAPMSIRLAALAVGAATALGVYAAYGQTLLG